MQSSDMTPEKEDEPVCKKARTDNTEVTHCKIQPKHTGILSAAVAKSENCVQISQTETDRGSSNRVSDSQDSKKGSECEVAEISDAQEKLLPLTEVQAGISEFIENHEGFSAIIKQRYSDFIVNEIDLNGRVVYLTTLSPPEESEDEEESRKDDDSCGKQDILSSDDKSKLEKLVKDEDKNGTVDILAPEDKDARTKIHLAVKQMFSQLETKTTEVNGQKVIQALWKKGKCRDSFRDEWPKSKKSCRYVKFVLYKENKDTMDTIGLIAKNLKVKESMFQYAGTKDKRAKTSQEITAHRIHPKKLAFLNKVLWNMGLGDFRYVQEPLKLGQLSGNQFTIVLRNVQGNDATVDKALSSLKSKGFINYFGMQRFGTTSVPTHKVGCALLHGDWDKAVDLILMPRNDNALKDKFQKVWQETHDPEATLKVTPRFCGLERNLLEALKKKLKPFNALEKISRNTRMLYVHSYQALIWNLMVSKRLKQLGHEPVIGDLAIKKSTEKSGRESPTIITSENLNQYSIHDVVLPLPGHDVIYPENDVRDWYRETMEQDQLDIDNMKRPQKDYSLPGAYRHVVVCPADVSWTHSCYDDYTQAITLSDLDRIKGQTLPVVQTEGKFKAVILTMSLPTSCYATMALREVMRMDTSAAHQTSLNVT